MNLIDDYKTKEALMHIDPFKKIEDYLEVGWVSEYDLIIYTYDNRVIHYDDTIKGSRYLRYDPRNSKTVNETIFNMEFKRRLKDEMQRKNITQEMMADMLDTQQPAISRYIKGTVMPDIYTVYNICVILNCNEEDLTYKFYRLK